MQDLEVQDAIAIMLNTTTNRALAHFDLALQTGDAALAETAQELLRTGLRVAGDDRVTIVRFGRGEAKWFAA